MKRTFITLNGMTLKNTATIIDYLNSVFKTFVATSVDLYDPCIIWYDGYKINIDSWSPAILDELDENHISYKEFNTVLVAYEFIRHEYTREKNNRKFGLFGFNNETIVNIQIPIRPYRKPRHEPNYDIHKTVIFRSPKENEEDRYMPVYAF